MAIIALILWTIIILFLGAVFGMSVTVKRIALDSRTYGVTNFNQKYYRIEEIKHAPRKGTDRNPY